VKSLLESPNDIGEKLLSLSRLFADDTSLGYSSQNVVEIENVMNHNLCELNTWSTKWLMSFNPDKTEIMLFSNTDVRYDFNFTYDGNIIPITMSYEHLGVTLSSDAKWNNHIENIILSVSRHLCILRKLKYRLSRQNLEKLLRDYYMTFSISALVLARDPHIKPESEAGGLI
jgi:hypothetical protein